MPEVKYVGGNGPLEIPGSGVVENDGTIDVSVDLVKELVARGDFEKAGKSTGGNASKETI